MSTKKTLLNLTRPEPKEKASSNIKSTPSPSRSKNKKFSFFKSKTKQKFEEDNIEELSDEVFKKYKDLILQNKSNLSFASPKFHLKSLDYLMKFPKLKPDKISNMDISNNLLKNIEIINNFSYLKSLNAAHNLIEEINLRLHSLMTLDLSNNRLTHVILFFLVQFQF